MSLCNVMDQILYLFHQSLGCLSLSTVNTIQSFFLKHWVHF